MTSNASLNRHVNIERRQVLVNGTELSFLEAGSGKPIVFVHGSVTTSELFRDTLAYYAERYRTIAVDLRGYGDSAKPGHGYTIEQFSADLKALFDSLRLAPAVLLGVSMGGFVAQRFALDYPKLLDGLVLASTSDGELAPGLLDDNPATAIKALGWRKISSDMITGAFPASTDRQIIAALLRRIDTWNEQVIAGAIASIKTFNTRDELQQIATPTLIMVGSEDHQLPVPLSERMHRAIKGSRLEIFQGVGHFMMVEKPDHFRNVLDRFLNDVNF